MDEEKAFQEHITVDMTGCNHVMEFWDRIKDAFVFPDFFGKNWDAFSDLMEDHPAHKVTVIGANELPKDWKNANGISFPDMIREILQENKEFKIRFDYEFDYEFIDE